MGEDPAKRKAEVDSLRAGLDLGLRVVDTAEMYGDGESERVVGEAIAGRREHVYLVSKVLPSNASRSGVARSCRASLKRLGVEQIDLYLLHWPGSVPLEETVEAFERLRSEGLIRDWGVSNFDTDEMEALSELAPAGRCAANQVLYNLQYRGIEHDLLPWSSENEVPLMAYSPVGQGGSLLRAPAVAAVARRHAASPAQIAIAWTLRQPNLISIPKAGDVAHLRENAKAAEIVLEPEDLEALDRAFPPPRRKVPLAIL